MGLTKGCHQDIYQLNFDYEYTEMEKPLFNIPTLSQAVASFEAVSSSRIYETVTYSTMENVKVFIYDSPKERKYLYSSY